jgi:hypothetical protein
MAMIDFTYKALDAITSIEGLQELLCSVPWHTYLQTLASESTERADEVECLRRACTSVRSRLNPESASAELSELKERVYAGGADDVVRDALRRIAELRSTLSTRPYDVVVGQLDNLVGRMFPAGAAATGYSNRARRARDVFTAYAGQTRIEGAETDRFGNAAGTAYDLGRDGAFAGHTVHVIQLYTGEGFDFRLPTAAFERKGFEVVRRRVSFGGVLPLA